MPFQLWHLFFYGYVVILFIYLIPSERVSLLAIPEH